MIIQKHECIFSVHVALVITIIACMLPFRDLQINNYINNIRTSHNIALNLYNLKSARERVLERQSVSQSVLERVLNCMKLTRFCT